MIRPLIFNKVSEGLFKQVKLDIVYFKSENEEEVQLRVSPLGLVQQDVRLYLVCCYEDTTQIRNLALHRIKKVELTTFIAEEPKGFDLQQYVTEVRSITAMHKRYCWRWYLKTVKPL